MRDFIDRHGVARWTLNFSLIVVLLIVGIWSHHQNTKADRALCALRSDVQLRVKDDEHQIDDQLTYLRDVRSGRRSPIPGVTAQDILRSIQNVRAARSNRLDTIASIDQAINCR